MAARSSPKTEQALDKLSDLRSRIKAARLEKLIARQMEDEVQLAPLQLDDGAIPSPQASPSALPEKQVHEASSRVPSSQQNTLQETAAAYDRKPNAANPQTQTSAPVDNSTTVAAAMERLVERDKLIRRLKTELEQKNRVIEDLELELVKPVTAVETHEEPETQPAINIGELAQLQRAQAEKFEAMQQKTASLELKLAQHKNRLEIAAEEKQIAEMRQDSLACKAHELESELHRLRKMQLSIDEEQERKDRTINVLEAKVAELSSIKLELEKHIINLRHIKQTEVAEETAVAG